MLFGWIFLIAVIVLVVYLVKPEAFKNVKWPTSASESTPIEILKQRYARGEITKEEFEEMKKNLTDENSSTL